MNDQVKQIYNDFAQNEDDTKYIVGLLIKQTEDCRDMCKSTDDYNKLNKKVNDLKTEYQGLTYFDNID